MRVAATGVPVHWLEAISVGSVSCGAITYIGNGPNFMVKAVAEDRAVAMPSFGGYIGWTLRYLVPTLVAMVCLFLAEPMWATVLGATITLLLLGRAFVTWRRYHGPGQYTPVIIDGDVDGDGHEFEFRTGPTSGGEK